MADASPHHLLLFDYVPDVLERRPAHCAAHLARIYAQREAGHVLLAGAIGDPIHGGAIVFKDLEASEVEEFVRTDPYMEAGLITGWRVERYHVV